MNVSIIEHEGVRYRKVEREANVGDKVIVTKPVDSIEYEINDVLTIVKIYVSKVTGSKWFYHADRTGRFLYRNEYAVLEPIEAEQPAPAMPKLTDAKPGDTVRIVNDNDITDAGYKIGDTFEVTHVWGNRKGVDAKDSYGGSYELYAEEFEVAREESVYDGLVKSLEEAAQLAEGIECCTPDEWQEQARLAEADSRADNVKKPAHYTQGGVEVIEYIEQVTAGYTDGFVAHCVGTAIKYVSRAPHKHATPTEDLRKAREYLNFAISRLEA